MRTTGGARIGNWYQRADGRFFRIVSLDSADKTVDVQYSDGDVEELELEYWYDLEPRPADNPDYPADLRGICQEESATGGDRYNLTDLLGRLD